MSAVCLIVVEDVGVLADDMEAVDLLKTCLSSLETVDSSLHGRIACWLLALHSHQYDTLDDQLALIQQRALLLAEHHYEQCLNIFLSLLYVPCAHECSRTVLNSCDCTFLNIILNSCCCLY
jgi:hypothetical protein